MTTFKVEVYDNETDSGFTTVFDDATQAMEYREWALKHYDVVSAIF